MNINTNLDLTPEDNEMAFNEVAFLIESFANTIDNIMGGATAPVGRIAGRDMARKLPLHLENPNIEEIIAILAKRMKAGFAISSSASGGDSTNISFKRCAIRDVCKLRKAEPGGAICKLFHSYFDGIVNELLHRPVKSEIIEAGAACRLITRTQ